MKLVAVALALGLALAGCGKGESAPPDVPSPVTGLITQVGKDFIVLRTPEGKTYKFDNAVTNVPDLRNHLKLHLRDKLPVIVTHEPNGNRLVARRIEDA